MITDTFLQRIAGLINGEGGNVPSHGAFSSSVITADATRTSLPTELDATRPTVTKSRVGTVTSYLFLRSGAIAGSAGDYINSMGIYDAETGTYLMADATISSLLHTTAFDVETDWKFEVQRL